MKRYDMVIIGGGPGGYTAALYAARAGLKAIVLEKLSAGGQMALTSQIDNDPGFPDGIDGFDLADSMQQQAERYGAETELAEVTALHLEGEIKCIKTSEGDFEAKTVVIATGANPKLLGVANEQQLTGRGVHYCAHCDGMAYRGKTVAVVGGGNSAVADALHLSRLAKKVYLIHRRDTLRAEKIHEKALQEAENIEFLWNSTVSELLSDSRLSGIRVANVQTGDTMELPIDGLFISVGRQPSTALVEGQLELDRAGYIVADETTRTSIPGVFAVGDVRTKALRQVVTAVADGAVATHFADTYLHA